MSELENRVPGIREDEDDDLLATDDWACDSDEKAEWCLYMIRKANESIKSWEEHYNQQMERIRQREQRKIDRMNLYLRKYLMALRERGLTKATKTADSYALPSGTLKIKRGTWDYQRDPEALVNWLELEELGEFVKIKKEPKWGDLKKLTVTMDNGDVAMKDSGEIVQGVRAVMKPDEFVIE